ncbi:MAG: hypothetical protein U0414_18980 [Polyangiaceae bacterium]
MSKERGLSASAAAARENAASWVSMGRRPVPVVPVMAIAIFIPCAAYVGRTLPYKTAVVIILAVWATWMTIVFFWRRRTAKDAWPPARFAGQGEVADLATAARDQIMVRCAGRVRAVSHIEAPRSGQSCVGYVARWALGDRASEVVSEAAPMELELASNDRVELETGRWQLSDPFTVLERAGEATLEDGAVVVVHARVEQLAAVKDDLYRGGASRYRLLADGGEIVPPAGYSSRRVLAREPSLAGDIVYASLIAAVAAGTIAWSRGHIAKNLYAPGARDDSPPRTSRDCSVDRDCASGESCEGGRCAPTPSGGVCSGFGDCPKGLRCRPIAPEMVLTGYYDPEAPPGSERAQWRCTEACRNDDDCPQGKLCVPCRGKGGPYAQSYDGNCFAREDLWGELATQCDARHAQPTPSAANSAPRPP